MNIAGKRVLITGGSSDIGLALAKAFLGEGAKVAISGRRPDIVAAAVEALPQAGLSVWGIAADVATSDGRAETLKQALDALDGLDIHVNNASGVKAGRIENTPRAELQAIIDVDLVAPIMLSCAALPAHNRHRGADFGLLQRIRNLLVGESRALHRPDSFGPSGPSRAGPSTPL